jgi:hypothetical protein
VDPSAVVEGFVAAVEGRHFNQAWAFLSSPLRARYTPDTLERDFDLEAGAIDRVKRAKDAARHPAEIRGDEARFSFGDGQAVRLVREAGSYRLLSLE